ncbi:hypothetical protein A4X09_0g4864, partial [Tilletia walkeri]
WGAYVAPQAPKPQSGPSNFVHHCVDTVGRGEGGVTGVVAPTNLPTAPTLRTKYDKYTPTKGTTTIDTSTPTSKTG